MPAPQTGRPVDPLPSSIRDATVARHLREYLPSVGLAERDGRTWVDGSAPPVRRLFQLQLLKGATVKACWGFSLDFVPHLSAGRLRWHRSDATARLDVVIDPPGVPTASYLHGAHRFDRDLAELISVAVGLARRDWERGSTFGGMNDLIRRIREEGTNRLAYANYTQLPIASAFLSARTGDAEAAERELGWVIQAHHLDTKAAAQLRQAAWAFR